MKIGFIGLGNVGFKLANSILESGFDLLINDLDKNIGKFLIEKGAKWIETPKELARESDISITCLPSPSVVLISIQSLFGPMPSIKPFDPSNTLDTAVGLGRQVIDILDS